MKRILVIATALILASVAFAQELPAVEALEAQEPVTIDAALEEAVWAEGEWYSDFSLLGKPDAPASAQTRFKIALDSENFYIAAVLDEPNMKELKATITNRDGRVHTDDCLEFMIDPGGDRTDYFHFTVNSLETRYDAELRQGGNVRSAAWDCPWEAAVTKQEASWTVEARVPLVHLGLSGASTGDWALNVARERYAGTKELSSFINSLGGFHQPTNYAVLRVPDVDLDRYLWAIKQPYDVRVMPVDGELTYTAKTHITNHTGEFWFISLAPGLQADIQHETGPRIHEGLDAGQGRELEFSVPVPQQGRQTLQLRVLDRRNPRRVLAIRSLPVELSYTPVSVDVTQPYYRNSIYATQDIDEIRADVTLSLTEAEMEGATVSAALMERTRQIARSEPVAAAPDVEVVVPIEELEDGEYRLSVLMDREGKVVHRASVPIHKLPPAPSGHEWRIGEGNILLHNGEPYLVYGWFGGSVEDLADPEVPYTAAQYYSAQWLSDEEVIEKRLDPVAEAGSFITIYPYHTPKMMDAEDWGRPLNDDEREGLRNRVKALKDHPAL
ncbi:MAG: sugar-binding protein, partial [Armatimonadota bacterium]